MEGSKVELVLSNNGESPMTYSGKEQGKIYHYEVTRICQYCPCNGVQKVYPLSAIGFSNYVLYLCSILSMKALLCCIWSTYSALGSWRWSICRCMFPSINWEPGAGACGFLSLEKYDQMVAMHLVKASYFQRLSIKITIWILISYTYTVLSVTGYQLHNYLAVIN